MISVVCVDSRSDVHPQWVQLAISSVEKQSIECELIVVDNIGRLKTIGEAFNEGVARATNEYVLFLGDDDYITRDYCSTLIFYALSEPNFVMWTTYMTVYSEKDKLQTHLERICTGMWERRYLLKYPFNETLLKGIDREYIQEMKKRGDRGFTIPHHFGYHYRKHEDYSSSGQITFSMSPKDIYIVASGRDFIDPIVRRLKKDNSIHVSSKFDARMADGAKIIWCEWANQNAVEIADYKCDAKKILRLHAFEAFSTIIHYIDFKAFNTVIFIAEHIKDYVEDKIGKLDNAVVIPVGVQIVEEKYKNYTNRIAYAGEISRKKGIGELFLLAKHFPDYEFCVAGKFTEDDTAEFFHRKKPDNITLEPYSYDLNKWFQDKTYIVSTSIREGTPVTILQAMACGIKPLIYDWIGAEQVFKPGWVWNDFNRFGELLNDVNPTEYREFVKERYDFEDTYKQIENIMELDKVRA